MRERQRARKLYFFVGLLTAAFCGFLASGLAGWAVWAAASERQTHPPVMRVVQDEEVPSDETDVPPQDVDKYIKVYQAMQHDRSLTVEQATAQQGLSVPEFRSLEDRIERNDALREHVRQALKPQASASPAK